MKIAILLLLLTSTAHAEDMVCERLLSRLAGAASVADNKLANLSTYDWNDCILDASGCGSIVTLVRTASLALSSACHERSSYIESCPDSAVGVHVQARASLVWQLWGRMVLKIEKMQAALYAANGTPFDNSLDYCKLERSS